MSILIKMEMPKNCVDCPLFESKYHFHGCHAKPESFNDVDMWNFVGDRPSWCPLIELPPHGRLIEDTVLDNMSMWNTDREYDRGWDSAVQAAKNRIKTAPTIIEAEGEDD